MNKNYNKGRRFEYQFKKELEARGLTTVRTSGSHGPFDLIAIEPGAGTYLIQCKVTGSKATANRLIKNFNKTPPIKPSPYYVQLLVVKIDNEGVFYSLPIVAEL